MAGLSKRILGPAAFAALDGLLYTVIAGQKVIIRRIRINNTHATTAYVAYMSIGADGAGTRIIQQSVAAGAALDVYGPFTLEAAETIRGHAGDTAVTYVVDAEIVAV